MRRRLPEPETAVRPPEWVVSFLAGLRHVGSVDQDGNVTLDGLPRLYAKRDEWMAENGFERGSVA